jgi:hypothetical protein
VCLPTSVRLDYQLNKERRAWALRLPHSSSGTMTTFYDDSSDQPATVTEDEFSLHKPVSRASTFANSNTTSRPLRTQPNALQRAHTVTQSASAKRTGRAMATDRGRKPHQRASSLLRTKGGGNESFPQRLLAHDMVSVGRIDNTFAVANVGNNGKLYLRYEGSVLCLLLT